MVPLATIRFILPVVTLTYVVALMVLLALSRTSLISIPFKTSFFYSAVEEPIESKVCFGEGGDGFLLVYKRLEDGKFQWPRSDDEARAISLQQFRWLTEGLSIEPKKVVHKVRIKRMN